MMRKTLMISCMAMGIAAATPALGAEDDPNILLIEARQGEMEVRAFSAGPLFMMAKGKIPYDAETAAKLANNLKVLTQLDMGAAWAPGTGKDKYPDDTHALPEIWSTYPKVAEAGKAYKKVVDEFAAVAGNGLDEMRAKIGDLGEACKGCHDDFREKE